MCCYVIQPNSCNFEGSIRERLNLLHQGGFGSSRMAWVWPETRECPDLGFAPGRNWLSGHKEN